ncbi:TRAP-type mannitol/chloroaromatic compound transport system permease small subunit [Tibeticola sediminis]|uniref:TRAP transporter small permease protein n=1 Tax=Tibeticola sediminis TaxID=1917811 RepID=A0A3N4U1D2_9BURK|nr:TRAP transporter small permease subunit [Tibeticola sediminis]RPE64606.1 TRAP-type mannitol/chloroaromatic compound transport system permease small subunit [Tibeticola sediminis]
MNFLLTLSRRIDRFTEFIGRSVAWLVLAAVLISAVNAIVRKTLDIGSNAFLELQWYLFAAVFMLGSAYTMMRQEHVRIDVLSGRLSKRAQIWIDIIGITCFLFPFVFMIIKLAMPLVINAYQTGEMSSNAGGLIRWPVFALLPLGLLLLGIQGVSELIKRIAFLQGLIPDPTAKQGAKSAEEELAEFLLQKEVAAREAAQQGGKA